MSVSAALTIRFQQTLASLRPRTLPVPAGKLLARFDGPSFYQDHIAKTDCGVHYKILDVLGSGSQGAVYLAEKLKPDFTGTGQRLALKVPTPAAKNMLQKEAAAYQKFVESDHKGLPSFFGAGTLTYKDKSGQERQSYFLATGLMDGNDLSELLEQDAIPLDLAFSVFHQAAYALREARNHGELHRDVKPENIRVDNGRALIYDFGLGDTGRSILGTPPYMSPEQLTGEFNETCDIYALGIVFYEMLSGQTPYTEPSDSNREAKDYVLAMLKRKIANPRLSDIPGVPKVVTDFIRELTSFKPADRPPSWEEVLRHSGEIQLSLMEPEEVLSALDNIQI